MEVFSQRLKQEYGASVISTAPMVTFKGYWQLINSYQLFLVRTQRDSAPVDISSPSDWPENERITETQEPVISATIVCPKEYMGAVLKLCTVSFIK